LRQGGLAGTLFFSPRTADVFARLVAAAGLVERLRGLIALCLSPAVAERLEAGPGRGAWREIRVADRPDTPSLLSLLDARPDCPSPNHPAR
ncbi:MAG: hypothetical protein V3R98_09705, partial [Alphaproteobacteria bacterium]